MAGIDANTARWLDEGAAMADRLDPLPVRERMPPGELDPAVLQGPEDFVALALSRSPILRAAEAKVRRLEERVPQVESLDDPMLRVAPVGEMAETAAGRVGVMTSLSQKLPLPAKLDARGRIAEQRAAQARAELERARVQLAADVRRAYWSHVLTVRTIKTTLENRAVLEQFRDVADAQYRSGIRAQQDVLRAAVELGSVDTELARLAQMRDTAAAMLRRLLNAPPSMVIPEPAPITSGTIAGERDDLLAKASRTNPALRAKAERIGQFEAQQRLAELNRWPDLTLSLSYNFVGRTGIAPSQTGDDQWWIGLGINLPIWQDKLDAAEREAMFGRLEASSALAAEHDRVLFDVDDALLRVASQQEVFRLLRTQVIPDSRAAVEASSNAYRTGTGDFLDLLDNWRKLLAQEVLEHRVATGLEQALADLTQAVGDESPATTPPTENTRTETHPDDISPEGETE